MPDAVDVAMDTTEYYAPPKPKAEEKLDLRTKEGRAAAGLPPRQGTKGPRSAAARSTAAKQRGKDYRPGIEGIGQLAAGALLFVAPADGAAIMFHTPTIAQALNDLAQENPTVAALLDRLLQVGPYGALLAAVAPLAIQILVNHDKLPAGFMGSAPPDALVAAVMGGQAA